jgi:hypothetical protein
MIASWGLPWSLRFVGLSVLILGVVSSCFSTRILHSTDSSPLAEKPAALTLRPGYTRPSSAANPSNSRDPESTLISEAPEKSIFRSSKYTRILFAWLIASYPFLIPPYVSAGMSDSLIFTDPC